MSSCMNTDVVDETSEVQSGKIAFETHVNKATRAGENNDITTGDLTQFFVAGSYFKASEGAKYLQIFNNVKIQKDGEVWKQIGGQERYWIKDAEYKFFAYSDGNAQITENIAYSATTPDWAINSYTVNADHAKDLIFATQSVECEKETGNEKVGLTFQHLLSKIKFTLSTDVPEGNSVKILNLKINNIRTTADYKGGKWNNWAAAVNDFKIANEISGITQDASKESVEKFVMPYNYNDAKEQIQVSIALEIYNSDNKIVHSVQEMRTSIGSKWEPGCKYNYNVNIKASQAGLQKIEFTVDSVETWKDGELLDVNKDLTFSTEF